MLQFLPYEELEPIDIPIQPTFHRSEATRRLMLREARPGGNYHFGPYKDASLVGQLDKLLLENGRPRSDVEAIGLCLNSAAPIADALRGVYAELGLTPPLLFGIRCSRAATYRYDRRPELRSAEADRLITTLEERTQVAVLDQYVSTGGTLRFVTSLLTSMGLEVRTPIMGAWYTEGSSVNPDTEALTSNVSNEMFAIGVTSVRAFLTAGSELSAS